MKFIEVTDLKIEEVEIGVRKRAVDEEWVAVLAELIGNDGQNTPIEVWRDEAGKHHLAAGRHRIAAKRKLGHETIRASVFEPETHDPQAEGTLHEVVENLARNELNALDRAAHLYWFKVIYEDLHPDTRRGVAGGKARQNSASDNLSVADVAAEKTGFDKRTIQRAVAIYTNLKPAVRDKLAGTWLASHQSQLQALSKVPQDQQAAVVKRLTKKDAVEKTVADAVAAESGHAQAQPDAADEAFLRLKKMWAKAPSKAKRMFIRDMADDLAKHAPRAKRKSNGRALPDTVDIEDAIAAKGAAA